MTEFMFAFLKRFRRKKPVAKPVASLPAVKRDPPPMPVSRPPRAASVQTPTIRTTPFRSFEVRADAVYEPSVYFPTPLYVPMDSPAVEVYTPPSICSDSSSSYSSSSVDTSSSYDCSSSSIDYGSNSSDSSWN